MDCNNITSLKDIKKSYWPQLKKIYFSKTYSNKDRNEINEMNSLSFLFNIEEMTNDQSSFVDVLKRKFEKINESRLSLRRKKEKRSTI